MRTLVTLFFIIGCLTVAGQSKKVTAETTLQKATVYTSGARLERTATVALAEGRTEIIFSRLSNQLDQQSVQLKADANVTLVSVLASKDFLSVRNIEDQEKELMKKIETLVNSIDVQNNRITVIKSEEDMLTSNAAIGGQNGVKTTELKEALDLHRQRLTELLQQKLNINNDIKTQNELLNSLRHQLEETRKKKDSSNIIVTAIVESNQTRSVNFRLLYNVRDAGWYPSYNARVSELSSPLDVLMNANVFQRSGETWKNISLALSTGNPNDNATPPELQPWKLGFYDPSVSYRGQQTNGLITGRITNENGEPIANASINLKNTRMGTVADANGFFKLANPTGEQVLVSAVGYDSKEIPPKPGYYSIILTMSKLELQEVVTTAYGLQGKVSGVEIDRNNGQNRKKANIQTVDVSMEYQPTTTVYQIKDKYTIETDGKTTTIGIKQIEIPASYEYLSVPKVDQAAYLAAKIVNWQNYDLQSGEASLYFEGSYLGKTYLDLSTVSDTLSLPLGKDNAIRITRKLAREFSSKRFIGSNRTDARTYEISVRNSKKEPVTITINDQFPVSVTKEISVDDMKAPEGEVDKESGIITWVLTLQPGQEKKLTKSYTVKYPKDRRVVLE